MELFSEMRTPQQALNYAVNRERWQANQHEILRVNNTKHKIGSDQTDQSVDADAALYIKEIHEDCANINLIRQHSFSQQKMT